MRVEQRRPVHLPGEADPGEPTERLRRLGAIAATPASTPSTQSSGSCSLHSGRGRETLSDGEASATTRWSASTSSAFTEDVPMSSPR